MSVPFSSPIHKHLEQLHQGNEDAVVDAIKGVCADMDALAAEKNGPDAAVFSIVGRLWPSRPEDGMRVRKYLVNGLLTIVSNRPCALRVELRSVTAVVQSVLKELCQPTPVANEADRQSFLKALNIMMFRLLENCRPQLTCQVLVSLLTETIDPKAKADYTPSKHCDLTMKCLIKLSKGLSNVDASSVEGGMMGWEGCIRSIDHFFTAHPPALWKTRGNDMPLKAVKTTLSHLCKALGSELLSLIDSVVPSLESGPAVIRQYADLMMKAAGKGQSAASAADSAAVSETAKTAAASSSGTEQQSAASSSSNEYLNRLHELRARYGLSVPVGTPAAGEVEEDSSSQSAAAAQAASEMAEKKIAELRARLQAVRAPYESGVTVKPSSSQPLAEKASNSSEDAQSPAKPAAQSAESAQAQLQAIRARLAKFQGGK